MRARAVLVLALALTAAACVGGSTSTDPPTDPATSGAASPQVTGTAVPEVLDFEAPLLGGGSLKGADLAGKDVAFWFWAPW